MLDALYSFVAWISPVDTPASLVGKALLGYIVVALVIGLYRRFHE
jgi:hypothetical protein